MPRGCILAFVCVCTMALSCKSGGGPPQDAGAGGAGGSAGEGGAGGVAGGLGGGGNGGAAGVGGMAECTPGSMRDCYSGPPGTANVGACTVGSETCNAEGTGYGACESEVLPSDEVPTPPGGTPADEDCDGMVDEPA